MRHIISYHDIASIGERNTDWKSQALSHSIDYDVCYMTESFTQHLDPTFRGISYSNMSRNRAHGHIMRMHKLWKYKLLKYNTIVLFLYSVK
jgi:hypothetical protein